MNKVLGVNIDHVATLREARGTCYPSIVEAAWQAIAGGAGQITVHLREDRRHIQDDDVYSLKDIITVPLNLEMAAAEEIINIALDVHPTMATLVPEKREELTTEGGLDCVAGKDKLRQAIGRLKSGGIEVSLFIEAAKEQIEMSKELGATTIELHTGTYSDLTDPLEVEAELEKVKMGAIYAKSLGLKVAAGHGLNYDNTAKMVTAIPEIVEYNTGHSIVARAIFVGLQKAVEEMVSLLEFPTWKKGVRGIL